MTKTCNFFKNSNFALLKAFFIENILKNFSVIFVIFVLKLSFSVLKFWLHYACTYYAWFAWFDISISRRTTIGNFNIEFQDLDLLTWFSVPGPFTMGKFINSRNEMEIRFPVLFMEQFQKVKYFWNQKNIAHFIKK